MCTDGPRQTPKGNANEQCIPIENDRRNTGKPILDEKHEGPPIIKKKNTIKIGIYFKQFDEIL